MHEHKTWKSYHDLLVIIMNVIIHSKLIIIHFNYNSFQMIMEWIHHAYSRWTQDLKILSWFSRDNHECYLRYCCCNRRNLSARRYYMEINSQLWRRQLWRRLARKRRNRVNVGEGRVRGDGGDTARVNLITHYRPIIILGASFASSAIPPMREKSRLATLVSVAASKWAPWRIHSLSSKSEYLFPRRPLPHIASADRCDKRFVIATFIR